MDKELLDGIRKTIRDLNAFGEAHGNKGNLKLKEEQLVMSIDLPDQMILIALDQQPKMTFRQLLFLDFPGFDDLAGLKFWLDGLQDEGLVQVNGESVCLTEFGKYILKKYRAKQKELGFEETTKRLEEEIAREIAEGMKR
jgi:hypothetical protein